MLHKMFLTRKKENKILLFRGIPEHHEMYNYALSGISKPFGGHSSHINHRDGDTRSVFTSWSKSLHIAHKYASNDLQFNPCNGVILVKEFIADEKSMINMTKYDIFVEDEVLVIGQVNNCVIVKIGEEESNIKNVLKLVNESMYGSVRI